MQGMNKENKCISRFALGESAGMVMLVTDQYW